MAARVVRAVRKHISAAGPAQEETKAVRVVHIDFKAVPPVTASGERARELEDALQQRFYMKIDAFSPLPVLCAFHYVLPQLSPKKRIKVPFSVKLKLWSDSNNYYPMDNLHH